AGLGPADLRVSLLRTCFALACADRTVLRHGLDLDGVLGQTQLALRRALEVLVRHRRRRLLRRRLRALLGGRLVLAHGRSRPGHGTRSGVERRAQVNKMRTGEGDPDAPGATRAVAEDELP